MFILVVYHETEDIMSTPEFNLNDHVYRLLQNEPFFAALSRRIDKKPGNVPTAGVRVNEDGHFEMVYSPASSRA